MYIFVVALSPLAGIGERVEACHGLAELNLDVKLTWFLSVDPRHLISTRTGSLAHAMRT